MPALAYKPETTCSEIYPCVGLGLAHAEIFEFQKKNIFLFWNSV